MVLNLTLILFSLIFKLSPGKFVSSCLYKEVGDKVVIPFGGENVDAYELRWSHNQNRVYYKRGLQIKHSELNVDQHGSLVLENVQKDKSGEYMGIAYNADGDLLKKTVQQLCVQEPVPEPTVLIDCVEKGVNLTCSAVNNESMVVSWMKNGMKANVTHAVLHVSSSELKSGDNFSCTVSNKISQKSAKNVQPVCFDTGLHATNDNEDKEKEVSSNSGNENTNDESKKIFLGLDLWWVLVILTGGGSFLLMLSCIICLVCVYQSCRRNKRKAKGKEQPQLVFLMPDYINQSDDQQKPSSSSFG